MKRRKKIKRYNENVLLSEKDEKKRYVENYSSVRRLSCFIK